MLRNSTKRKKEEKEKKEPPALLVVSMLRNGDAELGVLADLKSHLYTVSLLNVGNILGH